MKFRLALFALSLLVFCCGNAISQIQKADNGENWKKNCPCADHLTESQMGNQATHIEIKPEGLTDHLNIGGIVLLELTVAKDGRVLCASGLTGHSQVIGNMIGAVGNWRFKPYVKDGTPRQYCGRLRVKFSFVENRPFVEVVNRN